MNDGESPKQTEMQLLFTISQASKILGGMSEGKIREYVSQGKLKRCEHLGDRPWYFTIEQLQDFVRGMSSLKEHE